MLFRSVQMCFIWASAAQAQGLQSLQDFLQHSRAGRSDFVQRVHPPKRADQTPRIKTSRGHLTYQRPLSFRLEYLAPDRLILLADGKEFWQIDPDLQQVTVRDQKSALIGSAAALILTATDLATLRHSFEVRPLPDADGLAWVELNPKDTEGSLRQLRVGFQGHGPATRVAVIEFSDGFGQQTRLEFNSFEAANAWPGATFQYKPPPGYQVLRP